MNSTNDRQRAFRVRQREGLVWATVEIGPAEIFALQRLNLLPANRRPDKGTVSKAVKQFLACVPVIAVTSDELRSS